MQAVAHERPRTAKQRQSSDVLPASRLGPSITSQRTDPKIRDSSVPSHANSSVLIAKKSSIYPPVHNAGPPPISVHEIQDEVLCKSSVATPSVLVVKKSSIYPPVQDAGAALNKSAEISVASSPLIAANPDRAEPPRPMAPERPHSIYPPVQDAGAPLNKQPGISVTCSIYPTLSEHEASSTASSSPSLPAEISAPSSPPGERYLDIPLVDRFSVPREQAVLLEDDTSVLHAEPMLDDAVSCLNDPDWVFVPYATIDAAGTESRFVTLMREEFLEVDGWVLVPRCPNYSQAQPSWNVLFLHRRAYSFLASLPAALSRVFGAHLSSANQEQALRLAVSFANQVVSCLLSMSRHLREEIGRHVPDVVFTTLKTSAAAFIGFSVLLGHPFAVLHLLASLWSLSPSISIFLAGMAMEWSWSSSEGLRSTVSLATKQFLLEKLWPLLIAAEHRKTD